MKKIMNFKTPVTIAALTFALGACSSAPDYVACPDITSPEEGARVYLATDTSAHEVDVRFNGVNPVCTRLPNGDTRVDVSMGLKMKRSFTEAAADVVTMPILAAYVDADENVTYSEVMTYKAGFRKNEELKYPVAELQFDMPANNRLVLSLAPNL